MSLVWATWSGGGLDIERVSGAEPVPVHRIDRVPADRRFTTRFVALAGGGFHVRVAAGSGTAMWRVTGGDGTANAHRVELPDRFARLPPWQVVPFSNGSVAGLDGAVTVVHEPDGGSTEIAMPEGFAAQDVASDEEGRVWICGSVSQGPGRARRAWAVRPAAGAWELGTGSGGALRHGWRAALADATGEYHSLRRVGPWLVLHARGGEPDASSAFVWARHDGGRWRSAVLSDDSFRDAVAVADGVAVFSHRGGVVRLARAGRPAWYDLRPAVVQRLTEAGLAGAAGSRTEILGVAASSPVLLLAGLRLGAERGGEAVVPWRPEGVGPAVAAQTPDRPEVVALGAAV